MIEAKPVLSVGAELGEGPVWIERDRALWFVDIKAPRIHRFDPATGAHDSWPAPTHVGWILPASDGGLVVGLSDGLHRFDPATGAFAPLATIEPDLPDNRLNDATVDRAGRIWFGSMDNREAAASGRFYRLAGGMVQDTGIAPTEITNGPAVSPDGTTLYAVDTLARTIDAYEVTADGELARQRRFLTIDPAQGHPDGVSTDAEGGVWVGFYGGWAARRYDASGTLTHEVRFPAANVTKVALGGADGRTAFATTARQGLDAAALAAQPLAGDLFTFPVDISAAPACEARL
ncbi:MAG: SMP-30/gluconolactonase/LRE family protein [Sphingomonas sp.]|nr:SMP-30/gluconolactonase/LRE family protein [Sphingomonas sp.]